LRNPIVNSKIELKITSNTADKVQLLITDISGKKILVQQIAVLPGINQLTIPLPATGAKGIYTVQVQNLILKKLFRVLF
jgi:hypothetical protein